MPRYLIERSFPDTLQLSTDDAGAQICETLISNNAQEQVTWIHSYVSDDKKKTFCIYDAPSPEAIRSAASVSQLPVDRITQVRVLDPYFHK
jgi:hypothetical protein